MHSTLTGRHRAPSRISVNSAQIVRTTAAVAGASGSMIGLVGAAASDAPPAPALQVSTASQLSGPTLARAVVDAAAPVALAAAPGQLATDLRGADLLSITLPTVAAPSDRPVTAAKAPSKPTAVHTYGEAASGFVGVTPKPVVQQAVEQAATTSDNTQGGAATVSATSSRSNTSASRSVTRPATPARSAPAPAPVKSAPPPVKKAPAPAPAPRGGAESAIAWAKNHLGLPYVVGGTGPSGYDCSGFAKSAYAAAGVYLTHGSEAQYYETSRVSLSNIQRGDLLFYSNNGSASGIYHVAIYLGGGQVIHAARAWGGGFSGSMISDMNWSPGIYSAGRP